MKFTAWIFFILCLCGLSLLRLSSPEAKNINVPTTSVVNKVIDQVVIERGFVDASDKSVIQSFIAGSIIDMKKSGSYVKKGEVVARIDNSNYEDNIVDYDLELREYKLELAINQKKMKQIEFEEQSRVIERKEMLRHAQLEYKEELSKPTADDLKRLGIALQLAVLDEEEASSNLVRQKRLFDKGFLSKASLEPFERRFVTKEEKVKEAKLNISVAKKGIPAERKVELEQNLMRAKAVLERREKRKQRRVEEQLDIIKIKEQKIAEIEFKRQNLVEKSKQSTCYADKDGYIIVRSYWDWRSGGGFSKFATGVQVRERDAILEIVSPGKMIVNAIFNEADFHRLEVGQQVQVTSPSFPQQVYAAKLTKLGAIGKDRNDWMDSISGRSGVSMYNGTISFEKDFGGFQPGMSVMLKILLQKKYKGLVIPRSAVVNTAGKFWIHTAGKRVEVQGRKVNELEFEVTTGLKEGDIVSTFYPKDNS